MPLLKTIALAKEQSDIFKKLEKGKRYQMILDTGESVIIAVLSQDKIEETDEDMSDKDFARASQYSAFRDEEDEVSPEYKHLLKKIEL